MGARRSRTKCSSPLNVEAVRPGDVVGVGIHTGNALRGYEVGSLARARGAVVIFGGIHATLYPDDALDWAARTPSSEGTATSRGRSCSPMRHKARRSGSTRPAGSMPTTSSLRAGSCCRRDATCGARSDRPRLSEVLLVLLCLAYRWPDNAATAPCGCRRRGDSGASTARLPFCGPRRRQFES